MDVQAINKILVINLGRVEDVMFSTPALRSVHTAHPDSELHVLVMPEALEYCMMLTYLDNIVVMQPDFWSLTANFEFLVDLRKEEFDLVIYVGMLNSKKWSLAMQLLLKIIKPKNAAGYDINDMGKFFNIKIPQLPSSDMHESDRYLELVKSLGVEAVENKDFDFPIDEKSKEHVDDVLAKEEINSQEVLIGIHPGGRITHRWPVGKYCNVIEEINKRYPHRFVVLGSREETDLGKFIVESSGPHVSDCTGRFSLPETGEIIKRCEMIITNDDLPLHLAAMFGVVSISLFGPLPVNGYDPRKLCEKSVVLRKEQECAPCVLKKCETVKCLDAIRIEDVVQPAFKILDDVSMYNEGL